MQPNSAMGRVAFDAIVTYLKVEASRGAPTTTGATGIDGK